MLALQSSRVAHPYTLLSLPSLTSVMLEQRVCPVVQCWNVAVSLRQSFGPPLHLRHVREKPVNERFTVKYPRVFPYK